MSTLKDLPTSLLPKKNNRWIVEFPEEFDIKPYNVRSVTKPNYENGKWSNIEITFTCTYPNGPERGLLKMVKRCEVSSSRVYEMIIEDLDPTGVVITEWTIRYKNIVKLDFGKLTYDNDDIQTVTLVVEPYMVEITK